MLIRIIKLVRDQQTAKLVQSNKTPLRTRLVELNRVSCLSTL